MGELALFLCEAMNWQDRGKSRYGGCYEHSNNVLSIVNYCGELGDRTRTPLKKCKKQEKVA